MGNEQQTTHSRHRQRAVVLVGLTILGAVLCGLYWRSLTSAKDTYQSSLRQLDQMRSDAARVSTLKSAPQSASSRTRANEELLAQVEAAIAAAGIASSSWLDSVPQPPTRIPKSDYLRIATRIFLKDVQLEPLVSFMIAIQERDSTLRIEGLQLINRKAENAAFDVELVLAYLVFEPQP